MKILIVNTTLHTGGASIAAGRLAEALLEAGHEVRILTRGRGLRQSLRFVVERLEALYYNGFDYPHVFSIDHGGYGTDITRLPDFEWADTVHLHWVNQAMLSLDGLERLVCRCQETGKRLIWTLHDIWPATGICHLPQRCTRWESGCGCCPKLKCNVLTRLLPLCGRSDNDISKRIFQRKQQIYRQGHITFVACSRYLADMVRRSPLMKGQTVTDIANPIDTCFFSPCSTPDEKEALRSTLSLPTGKTILLFVAYNVNDANKGFGTFAQAVQSLIVRQPQLRENICVVAVGRHATTHRKDFACEMTPFEYIAERSTMRDIYRASDIFTMVSIMENLPNTIVEAKACGLPVVSTAVGGIRQMVREGTDGFLVPPADSHAFSEALEKAIQHPRRQDLSTAARLDAEETYDTAKVAQRYLALYHGKA